MNHSIGKNINLHNLVSRLRFFVIIINVTSVCFEIEGSLKIIIAMFCNYECSLQSTIDRIWGISYVYICSISSTKHPGKQCDVKVQ